MKYKIIQAPERGYNSLFCLGCSTHCNSIPMLEIRNNFDNLLFYMCLSCSRDFIKEIGLLLRIENI